MQGGTSLLLIEEWVLSHGQCLNLFLHSEVYKLLNYFITFYVLTCVLIDIVYTPSHDIGLRPFLMYFYSRIIYWRVIFGRRTGAPDNPTSKLFPEHHIRQESLFLPTRTPTTFLVLTTGLEPPPTLPRIQTDFDTYPESVTPMVRTGLSVSPETSKSLSLLFSSD